MFYCGIDPGLEGAFVIITERQKIVITKKIPTIKLEKETYDTLGIVGFFNVMKERYHGVRVFLEQVSSSPGQGVVSSFTMGYGVGFLVGVLSALELPFTLVRPQVWKKDLMAGLPKEKMASVVAANRLYPDSINYLRIENGRPDHNIADALLIAEWGRRQS